MKPDDIVTQATVSKPCIRFEAKGLEVIQHTPIWGISEPGVEPPWMPIKLLKIESSIMSGEILATEVAELLRKYYRDN